MYSFNIHLYFTNSKCNKNSLMQLKIKYTSYELPDLNSIYVMWTLQSNCFCKTKQMKLLAIPITRQNIPLPKTHSKK